MYRKIRTILALLFFFLITLLFLDISGALHTWFAWMAKLQFLPAVMAGNFVIVAAILLLTLLLGRVYCSVICPLGVMQDGFNFIARKVKKNRFSFVAERKIVRYSFLVLFVVLVLVGLNGVAVLVAPYSAYGRIATNLLQPVYALCNNLFAHVAERSGSYAFYERDVWLKSGVSLTVAAITLLVVGILAMCRGRTWCNTVCPVGTVLGFVSRFSMLRPSIDTDACKNCRKCERNCKSSCIDIEHHRIDHSRCVACMDCVDGCPFDALHLKNRWKSTPAVTLAEKEEEISGGDSRRKFLVTGSMIVGSAVLHAQTKKVDGGLAAVTEKKVPTRTVPLKPAGSVSLRNFSSRCTGCQLCVSECPNNVLRPSDKLATMLQPEMSFEKGFCRPECTRCSKVCPAGAIRPVTPEEKTDIHIGYAVVLRDNCLPYRTGVKCGNCAAHCPTAAISMVHHPDSQFADVLVPAVNADKCIGCGACEYLCPSRPFSAIYVNGCEVHVNG